MLGSVLNYKNSLCGFLLHTLLLITISPTGLSCCSLRLLNHQHPHGRGQTHFSQWFPQPKGKQHNFLKIVPERTSPVPPASAFKERQEHGWEWEVNKQVLEMIDRDPTEHFQRPGSSNMMSYLCMLELPAQTILLTFPSTALLIRPAFFHSQDPSFFPCNNTLDCIKIVHTTNDSNQMSMKDPSRVCCACLESQDMEGRYGMIGSLRSFSAKQVVQSQPGLHKTPS